MIKKIFNKIKSIFFKFNPSFKANNNLTKIGTIYGGYDIYNQNLKTNNIKLWSWRGCKF